MREFPKLLLMLPLLLVLGLVGCDNDNSSNAQDMDGGEVPGPAPEQASTTFKGTVIPPGDSSCPGGIAGIMDGDEIDAEMTSTTGMEGNATVSVNGGADGMFACSADGMNIQIIDTPPAAFIVCSVTSVSSGITGLKVGDIVTISIVFSGEPPIIKEAVIAVNEGDPGCLLMKLQSLNSTS